MIKHVIKRKSNVMGLESGKFFRQSYKTKAIIYYDMEQIKQICSNCKNIRYSDYGSLVSFTDVNKKMMCDLAIVSGKVNILYSKIIHGRPQLLEKMEINPDLTSEDTLEKQLEEELKHYIMNMDKEKNIKI